MHITSIIGHKIDCPPRWSLLSSHLLLSTASHEQLPYRRITTQSAGRTQTAHGKDRIRPGLVVIGIRSGKILLHYHRYLNTKHSFIRTQPPIMKYGFPIGSCSVSLSSTDESSGARGCILKSSSDKSVKAGGCISKSASHK